MANNLYTTKTASLKATKADVGKLDVKKINLKGKNILEYIGENKTIVKHAQDTRTTVTENDLWGQWIETLEDGTVIIHDDWIISDNIWKSSITKVEENKGYINDGTTADNLFYGNIQTEKIKKGYRMFLSCSSLKLFSSDLPNLTNGEYMFYKCSQLESFSSDLSNLTNGNWMFTRCTNLESFSSDLPSLTTGEYMFPNCSNLDSFSSDLSSLTDGAYMFQNCTNLKSFSSDLPSLTTGEYMFNNCSNLDSFSSDLSSLTNGYCMFYNCSLDAKSVMYIIHSIKDIAAEKQLYKSGTIPYVTLSNGVYSVPRGFMSDGRYVYTYNKPQPYTTTISASNVGNLIIGIDVTNNSSTIAQQLQTFAEGTLFDSWADLKQAFVDKGWSVAWQYGGTSGYITYDLRGGERVIPCPVYTKLIEILPEGIKKDEEGNEVGEKFYTEEQKHMATYCNEDGSKFYDIEWGHDVTHPEEFQQFDSLETACVSYGVMPKEYLETNGQTTLF